MKPAQLTIDKWDTQRGMDFTLGMAIRRIAVVEEWFSDQYRATFELAYSLEGTGRGHTHDYFSSEEKAIAWVQQRWETFAKKVMVEQ